MLSATYNKRGKSTHYTTQYTTQAVRASTATHTQGFMTTSRRAFEKKWYTTLCLFWARSLLLKWLSKEQEKIGVITHNRFPEKKNTWDGYIYKIPSVLAITWIILGLQSASCQNDRIRNLTVTGAGGNATDSLQDKRKSLKVLSAPLANMKVRSKYNLL